MKRILIVFLSWRFLLFLPLIFSNYFLEFRKGFEYTNSVSFTQLSNPFTHFLLSPWANFDGIYYLYIATSGYTIDNSAFFPLFPLIIKILTSPFGNLRPLDAPEYFIALILVSILSLIALNYFYKLVRIDYSKKTALWSIILLLIFPTSFFLASIYSEPLFLMLLFLSLYFARKRKWLESSIAAGLLTTTRFVGIAIFPALLYEFWISEKKLLSRKIFALLLIPTGLLIFMWYSFVNWQNPLHFVDAQGTYANSRTVDSLVFPGQTVFRYFKILIQVPTTQYEWWVALLELSIFTFACVLLFVAWRKKVRTSYLIFSIFALLIPILTGTLTGIPRYVLPLFPMFIVLSLIESKIFRVIYAVISVILLFILFALFSKGYFIS